MQESRIVRDTREYIHRIGGRSIKIQGSGACVGEPDLIFCVAGQFFAWEAKIPGAPYRVPRRKWKNYPEYMRKWLALGCEVSQADCLEEWKDAGASVGVFHSVDEIREGIIRAVGHEITMRT